MVVFRQCLLKQDIGTVHGENAGDEQDLAEEDEVGIPGRPSLHFWLLESRDVQNIPPQEEGHRGNQSQNRQDLDKRDQESVESTKKGSKDPMGAHKPVHQDLDQFDLGQEERHIDEQMENGRDQVGKHLLLTKSHQEDILPPLRPISRNGLILSKANIANDPAIFTEGNPTGEANKENKDQG